MQFEKRRPQPCDLIGVCPPTNGMGPWTDALGGEPCESEGEKTLIATWFAFHRDQLRHLLSLPNC